ncbi:CPBP family intramembrane glutamic endopeptidase [Haloarchaeobius sp. TZWWS8]|uniref:CPBP family intramembrane glutamic endopeptidase n=1 Tax=Haloarchaeobius sp. TZWWS8 TaxID=3446121 RepID=UPI003EBE6264
MDDSLVDRRGAGGGDPPATTARTAKSVLRFALLGFASLPLLFVYQLVLYVGGLTLFGDFETTGPAGQILSALSLGLATLTLAIVYIRYSGRDWSFVDLKFPSLRDVGYAVGGFVVLLLGFVAVSALFNLLGISTAQHSTTETARQAGNPALLLPLIPLSLLIIGPGEELLYRNVIQKSLAEKLGNPAAVVVASLIFALAHIPAYAMGGAAATAVASTLFAIFVLSLILGGTYALSENLLVPAFIHGLYNALTFYQTYSSLANDASQAFLAFF